MMSTATKVIVFAALCSAFLLTGCAGDQVKAVAPARAAVSGVAAAPALVAPPDQSVFTKFPRTVQFRWGSVPQAATYAIEIDCEGCCASGKWCSDVQRNGFIVPNLTQPAYEFQFWGDQRGRWRVWSVDAKSQPGMKSEWRVFSFQPAKGAGRTAPFDGPALSSQTEAIYPPGNGVTAAKAIYAPPAGYTDAARKAKLQGDVMVGGVVGIDGKIRDAHVVRSLDAGLDANALIAFQTWRFEPAQKDGKPVATTVTVMMSFHLQ